MTAVPTQAPAPAPAPALASLWLRGPVYVASATGLAVTAHIAAGGQAPDGVRLVIAVLVVGILFSASARREQSLRRVLLLVTAGQVLLHLVLAASPPQPDGAVGHAHLGLGSGIVMDGAHLCAAAVLALWLHRGERLAWDAVARAVVRLHVARRSPTQVTRVPHRTTVDVPRPRPCPALPVSGLRAPPMSV